MYGIPKYLEDALFWNMDEEPSTRERQVSMPGISNVIFHDPATIVYWNDGTKTVVKCQYGDTFNAYTGLVTAMLKRYMGNNNTFNRVVNEWLKRTGYDRKPELPAPTGIPALPDAVENCASAVELDVEVQ